MLTSEVSDMDTAGALENVALTAYTQLSAAAAGSAAYLVNGVHLLGDRELQPLGKCMACWAG